MLLPTRTHTPLNEDSVDRSRTGGSILDNGSQVPMLKRSQEWAAIILLYMSLCKLHASSEA